MEAPEGCCARDQLNQAVYSEPEEGDAPRSNSGR